MIDIVRAEQLLEQAISTLEDNGYKGLADRLRLRLLTIRNAQSPEAKEQLVRELKELFGGMGSFQDVYFAHPVKELGGARSVQSDEERKVQIEYERVLDGLYKVVTGEATPEGSAWPIRILRTFRQRKPLRGNSGK